MLSSLRRSYAELLTSGAQLLLIIVGFHLGTRQGWLFSLVAMALISLLAWYSALHRLRTIAGTPTSKVASAAQGYVELQGRGRDYEPRLISKLRGLPCLWYRYRVEEKNHENKWRVIDSGETTEPFFLDDGTGKCIIDPAGAEILTRDKDSWYQSQYRYTEWKLIGGDELYAIGHFKTVGGSTHQTTLNDEVKQVLLEWKLDMPKLRERFDLNNDGVFDEQEWMLARQAAKREAAKRLNVARAEPDLNFLVKPQDDRLFLISNVRPDQLARRYLLWTWAHVLILLGSLGSLTWLISSYS